MFIGNKFEKVKPYIFVATTEFSFQKYFVYSVNEFQISVYGGFYLCILGPFFLLIFSLSDCSGQTNQKPELDEL